MNHVASVQEDAWGERLPRRLGVWSATAVLVGTTIGSGIFRVPATVAGQLLSPGPVILVWVMGGLVALFGALSLAELAVAWPRSGGIFVYLLECFGPLPAFLFGWTELSVVRAAALGATATIFAEYLGFFIQLRPQQVRSVAAAAIVLVGIMNYIGVRPAAAMMNAATLAKYIALASLAGLAFTAGSGSALHFYPVWSGSVHLSLIATALVPVMWTYDGWADVSFISGEVKVPEQTLPRALILGTGAIVVIYLLITIGFIYVLPLHEMAESKLVAATVAGHIPVLARSGVAIVVSLVLVSTFSSLNGSMMTGPRIFFAMADRGLFFRELAHVSTRFRSPSVAIALSTALGVAYVLQNDFAQLADRFILGIWPFYALAVAGVFMLRRSRPPSSKSYRIWGYPLVPVLFLLASLGMIVNTFRGDPMATGITFAIILLGVPVYYLWIAFTRYRRAR